MAKGSSDVMASNEAHIKWYAALLCVTYGRGGSGVGDGYYHVCFDRVFFCDLPAAFFTDLMDVFTEDAAALLCKVNVFKNTMARRYRTWGDKEPAVQTIGTECNDFTRLNVTNVFGFNRMKSTGFAGNTEAARFGSAYAQRSDTARVACGLYAVIKQKQKRIGPL